MNLDGFERLRLVGDEDCGVGLTCDADECWDGGRYFAYYSTNYESGDPLVVSVATIADLMAAGRAHLDEHHAGMTS